MTEQNKKNIWLVDFIIWTMYFIFSLIQSMILYQLLWATLPHPVSKCQNFVDPRPPKVADIINERPLTLHVHVFSLLPPRLLGHWHNRTFKHRDIGTLVYWDTGTKGHSNTGTSGHWYTETLGQWDSGTMGHWDNG